MKQWSQIQFYSKLLKSCFLSKEIQQAALLHSLVAFTWLDKRQETVENCLHCVIDFAAAEPSLLFIQHTSHNIFIRKLSAGFMFRSVRFVVVP